ncbi:MAG TPA: hypothetical protein VMU18_11090 [Rhodoblastus sp.]|nr:hypothetical protein [Rhodoblastus sp.]
MLFIIRLLWLVLEAASAHLQNGLAYPVLLLAGLIGWRRWSPLWLLPLVGAEAFYAADMFAKAGGAGKLPGAMSNVFFQLFVFAFLALLGLVIGRALRPKRI